LYFFHDQKLKKKAGKGLLIDIELFHFKDFNIGLAAVLFHFMMHTSYLLLSAVFLQTGLGISPLTSGLYYIAPGILFTIASITASRFIPRFGTPVLQLGIFIILITLFLQIVYFKKGAAVYMLFILQAMYGLGNGFVLPTLLNITLRSLPPKYAGAAAGIYSTVQQTSSALGICLIGGLFYHINETSKNVVIAYHYGLTVHIICLVILSILLMFLPGKVEVYFNAQAAE
jgi:MFS family permease